MGRVYKYFHLKIADCDKEIEKILERKIEENERIDGEQRLEFTGKRSRKNKNDPAFDMHKISFQLSGGIDLSAIEGVSVGTIMTVISEVGLDLRAFPTAKHFASWLDLSPNNKISGGKVLSSKTVKGKNHLAKVLRHAANAIELVHYTIFTKELATKKEEYRQLPQLHINWQLLFGTC